MPQYPAVFELASLDGHNGFAIIGSTVNDLMGRAVSSAGDINGDGFFDVLVGAFSADPNGLSSGAVYVVYGTSSGTGAVVNIGSLDGSDGFRFVGELAYDSAGISVAPAGDINGDGISDILIGAYGADTNGSYSGRAYVVFGTASGFDATVPLSELDGTDGFALEGEGAFDWAGSAVAAAGDVNGDGFGDILIGAPSASANGVNSGAAYLVFGRASGFDAHINLSALDGTNGVCLEGIEAYQGAGYSVSSGDFNGDGLADLIVSVQGWDPAHQALAGRAYVIFGMETGFDATLSLAYLDGVNGFAIVGAAPGDLAGHAVTTVGDYNGDGFDDIAIGAPAADPRGSASGETYIVYGTPLSPGTALSPSDLDGNNGFVIHGEHTNDGSGWCVASAGDFNGDGFADLLVTASNAHAYAGVAYVVFGKAHGVHESIELSRLDGDNGFRLDGVSAGDRTGFSAAGAGDLNGDGFDDIVIGAPYSGMDDRGTSYVVYGSMPGEAVHRTGTEIANTIHGGNLADVLSGLDGNDTLIGHDGNDKLTGGAGRDFLDGGVGNDFLLASAGIDVLNGGDGNDRLLGSKGNDTLDGGLGFDILNAGTGANRFVFEASADSTGATFDRLVKADFTLDVWDVPVTVGAIDLAISSGTLRKSFFDTDLSAAVSDARLGAHHAVLFTPDHGTLAGDVFLIVDLNGIGGYQAGEDLVFTLANAQNLASLGTEDFI